MNVNEERGAVLLVTGAAGGLGQALVARAEAAIPGVRLALVSRDAARLRSAFGERHVNVVADVGTLDGAQTAVAHCKARVGTPTLLAHCVGNIYLGSAARTTEAQYRDTLRANLDSAFFMLSAVTAAAREAQQSAALCFVSTVAAQIGLANHDAIAAAKGGLEALVRASAATNAVHGIRINAVAPGLMDTPAAAKFLATPSLREASAKQVPLGSVGTPDELAELMLWMLSGAARRVTGQVWSVDGGFAAIRPLVR